MVQLLNVGSSRPTSARVQQRNEERRLHILRAASRVFRRRGVAAAGMREIAQEAGLSPGNLYHYFAGKDQILLYCQQRTVERMQAAADAAQGGAAERLRAVLRAHVLCMLDEMEGGTAHLDVEALPGEWHDAMIAKRDTYERTVRAIVVAGMRSREFAQGDAALVTRAMLGAVNWTARWYRPDGAQAPEEIAASLSEYLVKGLA